MQFPADQGLELRSFFYVQHFTIAMNSNSVLLYYSLSHESIITMNNALLIKKPYQLHLHLFVNLPNFLGPQRIRCFLLCKIDFHLRTVTVDPHFITSNYWFKKISTDLAHSSKPKVICFWCLFCSCITSCGTNFAATLLMCQSTVKMVCNNPNEMPKALLSFLIIRQWLIWTTL